MVSFLERLAGGRCSRALFLGSSEPLYLDFQVTQLLEVFFWASRMIMMVEA
jgi:hypothetical protein